jgi:hypothetical protein
MILKGKADYQQSWAEGWKNVVGSMLDFSDRVRSAPSRSKAPKNPWGNVLIASRFLLNLWFCLSRMRQFHRIIGFVAVSFVLVFIAKVNKGGLYTAYFKTIADVEVRNSTAHDHGDTQFAEVSAPREIRTLAKRSLGAAVLVLRAILVAPQTQNHDLAWAVPAVAPIGMRCFMEVAPRAPGA